MSDVVLVAIISGVFTLIGSMLGVIDVGQSEVMNTLIVALCEALTAFGVLNDPTSKNTF